MKTEIKSIELEKECEISGFIETTREQKTMLFIVLRDRSGKIQVAIEKAKIDCAKKLFNSISSENVKYHEVDSFETLRNLLAAEC